MRAVGRPALAVRDPAGRRAGRAARCCPPTRSRPSSPSTTPSRRWSGSSRRSPAQSPGGRRAGRRLRRRWLRAGARRGSARPRRAAARPTGADRALGRPHRHHAGRARGGRARPLAVLPAPDRSTPRCGPAPTTRTGSPRRGSAPGSATSTGLPPTLMLCGTRDLLQPGCDALFARAEEADWPMEYVVAPGLIHVYPLLPIPEAREAFEQIVALLPARLTPPSARTGSISGHRVTAGPYQECPRLCRISLPSRYSPNMDATDVAVIGAGVAGLTCARALEESGRSVRVLERSGPGRWPGGDRRHRRLPV